jgi:hypothetical protein
MLDGASMPLSMPDDAADLLKHKDWCIRRVVCGNASHGNGPTVFTTKGIEVPCRTKIMRLNRVHWPRKIFQVVMASTSVRANPSLDQQDLASHEVLVCGPVLNVHGFSHDGSRISFVTVKGRELYHPAVPIVARNTLSAIRLETVQSDDHIGMLTSDGYLVKFATEDGRYFLLKVIDFYASFHASLHACPWASFFAHFNVECTRDFLNHDHQH